MAYHPGCWHCRHPRSYWATLAALTAVLFVPVTVWLGVVGGVVLWANFGQPAVTLGRAALGWSR